MRFKSIFLSIIVLLAILLNIMQAIGGPMEDKISTLPGPFVTKNALIDLGEDNRVYVTYPDILPNSSISTLVIILDDKNKLASLKIKELSHYLTNAGMITVIINIPDNTAKEQLEQFVLTQIKLVSKYFITKSYNITNVAIIGNNISADSWGYPTVNFYPNKISYGAVHPALIFTPNKCDIPWKKLEKVTCVNIQNDTPLDEIYSQIKFWLQIHLMPCPAGTIKTADYMFGQVFCAPFPECAAEEVLFPFHPTHPVHCTQGSLNKFPYSHFFYNTIYAVDFASPETKESGAIYAAFDGVAHIYDKCKLNQDGTAPLEYCGYGLGNYIYLLREDGVFASYAHLAKIYVKNKQHIKRGQLIGLEGNTGLAGTRHLHFSLHRSTIEDPKLFNVHNKGFISLPFWLNLQATAHAKAKVLSLDLKCSDKNLIHGVWD
jgi:Peptidase family M23